MKETLKMMKSIVNGKEVTRNEEELIEEYRNKLSPNILAYFFIRDFGLIQKISKLYPKLNDDDKASFCLQELDNCLQTFDETQKISFKNYFIKFFKYRLSNEQKKLEFNKRKTLNNYSQLDELINVGKDDNIENYDIILDEYNLSFLEKQQCKLKLAGYTFKEISKLFKVTPAAINYRNEKIKKKILNFI